VLETYYANLGERDITRPNRIPPTVEELQESSRSALSGIHESCRKHRAYAIAHLRLQVARLADVLTLVPALAVDAIARRDRRRLLSAFVRMGGESEAKRAQLEGERGVLQTKLRPGMGNPNRVGELDALDVQANEIMERITSQTSEHATAVVDILHDTSLDAASRVRRLVAVMLELCDGSVYSQDLLTVDMAVSDWVPPDDWSSKFGEGDSENSPGLSFLRPELIQRRKQLESLEIVQKLRASPPSAEGSEPDTPVEGRAFPQRVWAGADATRLRPFRLGFKGDATISALTKEAQRRVDANRSDAADSAVDGDAEANDAAKEEEPEPTETDPATSVMEKESHIAEKVTALAAPGQISAMCARDFAINALEECMRSCLSQVSDTILFERVSEATWLQNWRSVLKTVRSGVAV